MPRFSGSFMAPKVSPLPDTFVPSVNESQAHEQNLPINIEFSFSESSENTAQSDRPNVSNSEPKKSPSPVLRRSQRVIKPPNKLNL